jgi:hypothetical protein
MGLGECMRPRQRSKLYRGDLQKLDNPHVSFNARNCWKASRLIWQEGKKRLKFSIDSRAAGGQRGPIWEDTLYLSFLYTRTPAVTQQDPYAAVKNDLSLGQESLSRRAREDG